MNMHNTSPTSSTGYSFSARKGGDDAPQAKGSALITSSQEKYSVHLNSDYWAKVSATVKARAGGRCQVCNSDQDLHAHHRTYAHRGSEMNHLEDLTCLCNRCHTIFHNVERHGLEIKRKRPTGALESKETPFRRKMWDDKTGTVVLTRSNVGRLLKNGSATAATINALGLDYSFTKSKGWKNKLVGRLVTVEAYEKAVAGKKINSRKKIERNSFL